jgi:hypothetical protein
VVAIAEQAAQFAYFAVPLFVHRTDDLVGRRVAAVQMMALDLARQDELSTALDVNRTTLYRQQRKVQTHGVLGVVDGKRGPRGPHRFTVEKRRRVEALEERIGQTRASPRRDSGQLRQEPPDPL